MRETFHRMADRMESLSRRVRNRGNGMLADQYMDYAASYRNSILKFGGAEKVKRESELLPIMLCFAWESKATPKNA